jgi:hypothetical protein
MLKSQIADQMSIISFEISPNGSLSVSEKLIPKK